MIKRRKVDASTHYNEASYVMPNCVTKTREPRSRIDETLRKYADRWQIAETHVYTFSKGIMQNHYFDNHGKLVHTAPAGEHVIIGKRVDIDIIPMLYLDE